MVYSRNKQANHNYELTNCIEVGISLLGPEVSSIRQSNINLKGSYVSIIDNSAVLKQAHISRPGNLGIFREFIEKRDRNLLLHKKQIQKFKNYVDISGYTLIIRDVYQPDNSKKIKCTLCLALGLHTYDKKQKLKEKQLDIESKRAINEFNRKN